MRKSIFFWRNWRWSGRRDLGIDLGTASILIYVRGKGIVLEEPSVVAVDQVSGNLLAVGAQAQDMLGRTPHNIKAVRPLSAGVIANYEMTERMLAQLLRHVLGRHIRKPNVVICVPACITEVEERAVIDAGLRAGAKRVYLVEEPLVAAMGAGLEITRPQGRMVVDIGGGTTEIAVLSLGNVVCSRSIAVAGDSFDAAIIKYVRRKYNILIGERTAEQIKRKIGCSYARTEPLDMQAKGRCLLSGLPRTFTVTATEMLEALTEVSADIMEAIHTVLEEVPPELTGDLLSNGIVLTGGGALLWGFDLLIASKTGLPTRVAEDSLRCVALGTGMCLEQLDNLRGGTLDYAQSRNHT